MRPSKVLTFGLVCIIKYHIFAYKWNIMKTKKIEVTINELSFNGNMVQSTIEIDEIPLDILRVDDWYSPTIGELCINADGQLDIVKDISFRPSDGNFKAANVYSFEISKDKASCSMVQRVEVNPGLRYIFHGRVFVHQEFLDGGYIDKIAKGQPITDYEYGEYDKEG